MVHLALILTLTLPGAGCPQAVTKSPASSRDSITGVPENRPPVIECDLDESTLGEPSVEFQVTAVDPDGDRVSLRLVHQPQDVSFAPLREQPSPGTGTARWSAGPGPTALVFEAHDDVTPEVRVRREIRVVVPEVTGIQVADVTGDDQDDVVLSAPGADVAGEPDAGSIYVWFGTATPTGVPDLTLSVPGAVRDDSMQVALTRRPFVDLTGDGQIDIIGEAPLAEVGGVERAGAIYVWAGGPDLANAPGPTAILGVPGAGEDWLGSGGLFVHEVTGDGFLDLIAGTPRMEVEGVPQGGVHVFAGGPTLIGQVAPLATLVSPWPTTRYARFGSLSFCDVSGDGTAEIIVHHRDPVSNGVDEGAIFVWKTGAALVGTPPPHATLIGPVTGPSDSTKERMLLAEVSGDGIADLVMHRPQAGASDQSQAGIIYVWKGGPGVTGMAPPTATLMAETPVAFDQLGSAGVFAVDVTDDGILDVVAASPALDFADLGNAGAILVFAGGRALAGAVHPAATLTLPRPQVEDWLSSEFIHLTDFNGDAALDILASSRRSGDEGALHIWTGGSSILSSPPPTTWTAPGFSEFQLTLYVQAASDDLDGDGIFDFVLDVPTFDNFTGATLVWYGRPSLTDGIAHDATCILPGSGTSGDSDSRELWLVDVSGDSKPDIVHSHPFEDFVGIRETGRSYQGFGVISEEFRTEDAGAIHVWNGGARTGILAPTASLRDPEPLEGDGHTLRPAFGDVTGDGVLDILAIARKADSLDAPETGQIHVWSGGPALVGTPAPLAAPTVPPTATSVFRFGESWRLIDWNRDGALDLFAGSPYIDSGAPNTGAMYFWSGSVLSGTRFPDVSLNVPGATSSDELSGFIDYTYL